MVANHRQTISTNKSACHEELSRNTRGGVDFLCRVNEVTKGFCIERRDGNAWLGIEIKIRERPHRRYQMTIGMQLGAPLNSLKSSSVTRVLEYQVPQKLCCTFLCELGIPAIATPCHSHGL